MPSASSGPSAANCSTTSSCRVSVTRGGCFRSSRSGTTRTAFILPSTRTLLITGRLSRPRWARSSRYLVSAVFITGTRDARPEAIRRPQRHTELSTMPSDSVRLPAARFSVTETTERHRSLSLRPTSLARPDSLVEAGSVPSLAPPCDFGDPQGRRGRTRTENAGESLVPARQRPPQFPLRPYNYSNLNRCSDRMPVYGAGLRKKPRVGRWFLRAIDPGNFHCTPTIQDLRHRSQRVLGRPRVPLPHLRRRVSKAEARGMFHRSSSTA